VQNAPSAPVRIAIRCDGSLSKRRNPPASARRGGIDRVAHRGAVDGDDGERAIGVASDGRLVGHRSILRCNDAPHDRLGNRDAADQRKAVPQG
jgi:hypothetical protein